MVWQVVIKPKRVGFGNYQNLFKFDTDTGLCEMRLDCP